MIPRIWGVCLSLKDNPSLSNPQASGTVLLQLKGTPARNTCLRTFFPNSIDQAKNRWEPFGTARQHAKLSSPEVFQADLSSLRDAVGKVAAPVAASDPQKSLPGKPEKVAVERAAVQRGPKALPDFIGPQESPRIHKYCQDVLLCHRNSELILDNLPWYRYLMC
jgi:hypothetical protein